MCGRDPVSVIDPGFGRIVIFTPEVPIAGAFPVRSTRPLDGASVICEEREGESPENPMAAEFGVIPALLNSAGADAVSVIDPVPGIMLANVVTFTAPPVSASAPVCGVTAPTTDTTGLAPVSVTTPAAGVIVIDPPSDTGNPVIDNVPGFGAILSAR